MAEEEELVVVRATVTASSTSDHKRKLEDQAPNPPLDLNVSSEPDAVENVEDEDDVLASDTKRPRIEDETDGLASENGYKAGKEDEAEEEDAGEQEIMDNVPLEDAKDISEEAPEMECNERPAKVENNEQPDKVENSEQPAELGNNQPGIDNHESEDGQKLTSENLPQLVNTDLPAEGEHKEPSLDVSEQGNIFTGEQLQQPMSGTQTMSRKMDVPSNKVGVLIGKAGDTIRYLQYNSGAKIQITRDGDADPYSSIRPVELIGGLESINKAEKLIKDVIAEADAGGSPSLVAQGFATAPAAGGGEQIQIQVHNDKVGLIIGKGGENIRNMQTRSGARIQLIPQHLPEGDQSKVRTVRVSGDMKQIEMAREMIRDVMNKSARPSPLSSSYNEQTYRPRGPPAASQWSPRGPHPGQSTRYDYQHRGPHPSQNSPYPLPTYGSYPSQRVAPRGSHSSGWEQRPPTMQGPPHSGGYDYYGGPGGGHLSDPAASAQHPNSFPAYVTGCSPAPAVGAPTSQANYNYGQAPYSQTPPQQGYGHGYEEPKYGNQGSTTQHPYGVHGGSHPTQPGYVSQQQYGRPPSYGMQSQGPYPQSYGPTRASQPGDIPYQAPYPSSQLYGQNVSSQQQPYPYASSGPMQQTYPTYGSGPTGGDGYNQQPPATGQGYAQQAVQPVSGYGQPGGQPGYGQGPQGGYGAYPSTQPAYGEQATVPAPTSAGYGYLVPADPSYDSGPNTAYAALPSGQQGYAQPVPTQPTYDQQSVPPSGGYVSGPGSAPVG